MPFHFLPMCSPETDPPHLSVSERERDHIADAPNMAKGSEPLLALLRSLVAQNDRLIIEARKLPQPHSVLVSIGPTFVRINV